MRQFVLQCFIVSVVAWGVLFAIWYLLPRKHVDDQADQVTKDLRRLGCDDANHVLRYLENSTFKKWFVICIPNSYGVVVSKGFHTAVKNEIFIAAISVVGAPEFSTYEKQLIEDFRFPIETVRWMLRSKEDVGAIYQHFENHMTQGLEFLVITTPCGTTADETMAISDGVKWTRIINQDACINKQVIAIPSPVKEPCRRVATDLRHLTVEGDYVIVRKDRVTKWKFVNSTLQNENGKCLTAWGGLSTYLFESDCCSDWKGQIWIKYGLQVVNGFRLCLATRDMYAIHDFCDSLGQFLWNDRECQ